MATAKQVRARVGRDLRGHGEILVADICGWNRSGHFVTDPVTMGKCGKPLQLKGKQYRLKFLSNADF
jgi:hypothetical protein